MFQKKSLLLVLALVLFATPAFAAGKTGIANLAMITTASAPGLEAEKQLQALFGDEKAKLEKQAGDINAKVEELNKQAAALSEKARNDRAAEIEKLAKDLETKSMDYSQRLATTQNAISTQLNEVVMIACKNFATKNDYDMIIDGSVFLYADEALNVADGLLKEINEVWQQRGSKYTNLTGAPK